MRTVSSPATVTVTADRSWRTWTLLGLAAIWIAVALVSVMAPDLVSGSQHEHLPLALFVTWIWGLLGSIGYLWGMSKLRGPAGRRSLWTGLTIVVLAIWAVAVVVSATFPVWETGSDPTLIPIWALAAPIGAALVTTLASVVAGILSQTPG